MTADEFPSHDPRPPDVLPTPAERVWSDFLAFLAELPSGARAAFLLHDVFRIDHAEIARMLGASPDETRRLIELARVAARRDAGEGRAP